MRSPSPKSYRKSRPGIVPIGVAYVATKLQRPGINNPSASEMRTATSPGGSSCADTNVDSPALTSNGTAEVGNRPSLKTM